MTRGLFSSPTAMKNPREILSQFLWESCCPRGPLTDLKAANRARERTVFVISASDIGEFLTAWVIKPWSDLSGYAVRRNAES